jgi:uncharacterized protein (TIGR02246 family)
MRVRDKQAAAAGSRDEAAIHGVYQQLLYGWNTGSGEVFASPFSAEADFIAFDGTQFKGRQEIAAFHQQLFDTFVRGTRLVGKVRSIRFVTDQVALVIAVGGTVLRGRFELEPEHNSIQTLVVARQDGQWQITAYQSTRADYTGRPEAAEALTAELRALL